MTKNLMPKKVDHFVKSTRCL